MASFNKVILMGNLTREVELAYTPSGAAAGRIGLAMNRKWTDQNTGQIREEVTFIDVQIWGKTAENVQKFLNKGSPVHVEGRLKLESWVDKQTNQKRSKVVVVAERVTFLNRGQGQGARGQEQGPGQEQQEQGADSQGSPAAPAPAAGERKKGVAGIPQNRYPRSSPGMAAANAQHDAGAPNPGDLEIPEENIPF